MPGNITGNPPKLDNAPVNGLLGVPESLAYYTAEIERHLHHYNRFLVKAAIPNGEIHVADRWGLGGNITPFRIDGGNDTWGAWVQIIGTGDTPVITGRKKFDLHELHIVDHERNTTPHMFEVASGEGTPAEALAAENFTQFPVTTGGGNEETGATEFTNRRQSVGCKVWVRVWSTGQATGWVDFWPGLHEYKG